MLGWCVSGIPSSLLSYYSVHDGGWRHRAGCAGARKVGGCSLGLMCVTRGAWGRRFAGALAVRAWRVLALAALITVVEVLVSFPFVSTVTGRLFASRCGAVRVAPEGVPPRVLVFVDEGAACLSGESEGVTVGRVIIVAGAEGPLLRHELAHVQQAERLGSLGFAVSYGALKVWTAARGGHPYLDHPFELDAIQRE